MKQKLLYKKCVSKTLLIMKLTLLLTLVLALQVTAKVNSQRTTFIYSGQDVTLEDVFSYIETNSEFRFFYPNEYIDLKKYVSVNVENATIDELLQTALKDQNLAYRIFDGNLVVIKEEQPNMIKGKITDINGRPLPGVNVVEKGTTNGSVTNLEGEYSISVSSPNAILSFSFIGFLTEEIELSGQITVDVVLIEDIMALDEVVVVGYGTQKKINLTGSISQINAEELTEISMPTLAQSAMGRASGVYIKNVNGQPGDDTGIDINIRGFGTPLIIIDGLPASEWDFQQLDPNDIEDLNILKDAAATAVYGARAGNGVILVTTKRGKISEAKFTYNGNFGMQYFCVIPEFVSSAEYAEMENLARFNQGLDPIWTSEEIQKFRDGSDPRNYPNTDWWDASLRSFAPQSQHNINARGGTEKVKYFVSGGYFHQDGMIKSDDIKLDRYTLRSNLDVMLSKKFDMGIDISVTNQDYIGPRHQLERRGDAVGIMTMLYRARPYWSNEPFPDPSYTPAMDSYYMGPLNLQEIDQVGYLDWTKMVGDVKLNFSYDLPWGFEARAIFNLSRTYYRHKEKYAKNPLYTYDWETDEYSFFMYTNNISRINERRDITNHINQQYFLTWNKKVNDHNISALFVYETLSDNYDRISASRENYEFDLDYLFAGPDLNKDNDGFALEGGRKAYIGRINYDYKGKYLVEVNSRYDASPYFPEETRWGFFPSASLGWRISEEDFIKDNHNFINNLKLRVSYGKSGYDHSDESEEDFPKFQYLSTYSIATQYIYDSSNELLNGIRSNALPNSLITWEKMYTSNVGVDFNLWSNKLEGSFDYFYRKRTDVLGQRNRSVPNVVGANMPQENYAKYDNRGWEFTLNHKNKIGEVSYSVGGNISWNREKYVYIDQTEFVNEEARRRGNNIGEWTDRLWKIPTDGLFESMEEIQNWADIDGKNNATILPGDVKFVDTNGDGRITSDDMIIAGRGNYPRFTYGLNMSASWKRFDFSMLWQGAGLYNFELNRSPDLMMPFYANNTPIREMYTEAYVPENPWIPTNTDTNARYPRYRTDGFNRGHDNFYGGSDFWLINGAYIRLKTIQLAYNLPTHLIEKWGIENCKIYVSGYNVLTFSELKYIDPEIDTDPEKTFGDYYPPVGTYNVGITLQF